MKGEQRLFITEKQAPRIKIIMKYMTFNSSCSYAGLANLLSFYHVDTEDWQIAVQMQLPYLFAEKNGQFLSGPMLQGGDWFNLYLNPIGFRFEEYQLDKKEVCSFLSSHIPAMLGIRVSPESKHAVIFTGRENGTYKFLNNKRQDSIEPDTICLSEQKLLKRLDEKVTVGTLCSIDPVQVDLLYYLKQSEIVFQNLRKAICNFCGQEQSPAKLHEALNILFRAVLLDGISMLELLNEQETASMFRDIQSQLLGVIKKNKSALLKKELDMVKFYAALDRYSTLIAEHINKKEN